MARDGDLPTIFNPKRVRAPSVIVTSDELPERLNGPSAPLSPRTPCTPNPPLTPQASITSQPPLTSQRSLHHIYSESGGSSQDEGHNDSKCPRCCSELARKMYYGMCVTIVITASWVLCIHSIKYLYLKTPLHITADSSGLTLRNLSYISSKSSKHISYNAPFFTTWFSTNWSILFFPIYIIVRLIANKCAAASEIVSDSFRNFREKGFTFARFLSRCGLFCLLWVTMTYMFVYSLGILLATDAAALFATNVSCVYLLSWVILHQQFVGVRIVAVILCDTGIALLAYMDGITGSPTLGGVVLAATAAAGFAIYKVLFRKVIGDATYGQTALFFSLMGLLNVSLLWPVCLALYLTGAETLPWDHLPWTALIIASVTFLIFNLVYQFGAAITYEMFVTLGLITAVPVSAALDVVLYGAQFEGMKLAGVILIGVGFFLVMFPDNWPDYIMRLLRWSRQQRGGGAGGSRRDAMDYRTGYIRSHLRSPSGRVR